MIVIILALLVAMLFATGTYLVLRRSSVKLILGLGLLSHGVNLLLFGTGNLRRAVAPILDKALSKTEGYPDPSLFADPLPQALILTAIVISFGITAFMVVVVKRLDILQREEETAGTLLDPNLDPAISYYATGIDPTPDDHEWLEYSAVDDYRRATAGATTASDSAARAIPETVEVDAL